MLFPWNKYPYTDLHELNLTWVLEQINKLSEDMKNFIKFNSIKYADPLAWNITTQYTANTVVIDPATGIAYLSTKAVPSGVAITDTDYWTAIFDMSAFFAEIGDLDSLLTTQRDNLVNAINEVFTLVSYTIVTPEMFGAVGDGVTDDTDAFKLMRDSGKPVYMLNKTYLINEEIVFSDVCADHGSYVNYKPMYAKKLSFPIDTLSIETSNVSLGSYIYDECLVYINNKYYVFAYDGADTAIIVYNSGLTITETGSITGHTAMSACTDGDYIYIDFTDFYHAKINVNDISDINVWHDSRYLFTCFYNNQFYAISFAGSTMVVSRIDNTFTTLSDSFTVTHNMSALQSATIFNGQLYVLNPNGYCCAVDLVSHDSIMVPNFDSTNEIECLFEKDGELYATRHLTSTRFTFNICKFNSGIDYRKLNVIDIDAAAIDFAIPSTLYTGANRPNVYHITNGLAHSLPIDDCDLLWTPRGLFAYSVPDNQIYAYDGNAWIYKGGFKDVGYLIDSGNMYIVLTAARIAVLKISETITATGVTHTNKQFAVDLSALYTLMGWDPNYTFWFQSCAHQASVGVETGADYYNYRIRIGRTSQGIEIGSIINGSGNVDCAIQNTFVMEY